MSTNYGVQSVLLSTKVNKCRYLVKIVDKSKVGGGMDRRTKSVTPNTSKIELNTLESNPNFLNILSNATISYL